VAIETLYKFTVPLLMKQVVQNKKMIHVNHTEVSHTEILENHAVSGKHFSIHKKTNSATVKMEAVC
jgi:hypothetical protein